MLRLTLLGTGAAGGVPLYGCECIACERARSQAAFERKPCSAMLEWGRGGAQERLLIDAGLMDLHSRFAAGTYYGFLLTHFHVDHVQGLFHLRWGNTSPIPVWCPDDPQGCADLLKHPGCLSFKPTLDHGESFNINRLKITPLAMKHSRPTMGFLFEYGIMSVAYLTDTDGLSAQTLDFLLERQPIDAIVLDCSFPPNSEAGNHGNLDIARLIQEKLKPKELIITHIGHDLDRWLMENGVPNWVEIGRDGMEI
ncbi:phosphonate metabolism protein PhnP [Enterovibrio norvegicus FF-33]|uniref:phosphonate metabolism protein PhnP n=1 Tax=Enterovibrio norvegicus TaxID=188144 RepID=UPI00036F29DB|nr:phosphonate metabolism protein PhnP [Enterovibrio norvegicus]OEE66784.1 phosphonate metabolism protein PhnP [Enterovibrio norvegicus FF-33]